MEYKVTSITINKKATVNLGNYESAAVDLGLTVEPTSELKTKGELDAFVSLVNEDVDSLIGPQIKKLKEFAAKRHPEK